MVLHTQVDWRTPEQAYEWDLALVEGVFRRVIKRYDDEAQAKPHRAPPGRLHASFADRLVTKADVLIGLQHTEQYLCKRPFLRVLYTNLACCSNEREMESVASYVKLRLRERTISFSMVRERLQQIYKKHIDLLAFEARVSEFKAAARAKSTWCVRDFKSICPRPSRFYGVHNIPPKPKTQKQIDLENQITHDLAAAVVNSAIQLVTAQLVDAAARPKSRARSDKSGRHSSAGKESPQSVARRASLAAKAKQKRNKEQLELRRKELRLEIMVPGIAHTHQTTLFGVLSQDQGDQMGRKRAEQMQQELLALIEANGDTRIAQLLLDQRITRSGFARVSEHLTNLGADTSDAWGVVKLWKSVYRTNTIQSIQRLQNSNS